MTGRARKTWNYNHWLVVEQFVGVDRLGQGRWISEFKKGYHDGDQSLTYRYNRKSGEEYIVRSGLYLEDRSKQDWMLRCKSGDETGFGIIRTSCIPNPLNVEAFRSDGPETIRDQYPTASKT